MGEEEFPVYESVLVCSHAGVLCVVWLLTVACVESVADSFVKQANETMAYLYLCAATQVFSALYGC